MKQEPVTAKILEFFVTNRCTLNCKMCLCSVPYLPHPRHTPKEELFRHFALAFPLYDSIGRVEIIGGEPLMHPHIAEIIEELIQYREKIPKIRITTNATIVPGEKLLAAVHKAQEAGIAFDFLLDNYGPLSRNLEKIQRLLEEHRIDYRVDQYTGENQRGNGWLCYGDFTLHEGETEQELWEKFQHCLCPKLEFHDTHEGKIYSCVYAMTGVALGKFQLAPNEYVDLTDSTASDEEKREILRTFLKRPTTACRYCDSFLECSPRFPAAEQLPRREEAPC